MKKSNKYLVFLFSIICICIFASIQTIDIKAYYPNVNAIENETLDEPTFDEDQEESPIPHENPQYNNDDEYIEDNTTFYDDQDQVYYNDDYAEYPSNDSTYYQNYNQSEYIPDSVTKKNYNNFSLIQDIDEIDSTELTGNDWNLSIKDTKNGTDNFDFIKNSDYSSIDNSKWWLYLGITLVALSIAGIIYVVLSSMPKKKSKGHKSASNSSTRYQKHKKSYSKNNH